MLFLHIPLADSDHAVDVHLEGDRLFRPIQCPNQYARDFKYEHCGSVWNQRHHLSINQATCKRASPYQSQLDSLDYCHARDTKSAWDNNSDLEGTDATAGFMLYEAAETRWWPKPNACWTPGCGPCQLSLLTPCFMTCISSIPTLPRSMVSLCPFGSAYELMSTTLHQGMQSHSTTQTQLRVLMRSCQSCGKLAPSQPFIHARSLIWMSATTFGYAKYLSTYGGLAW